jgi:D-alanine-D-alanine ligase
MSAQGRVRAAARGGGAERGALAVAVLAGGRSSEHEVSLSSAAAVRDGLLEGGHEVVWVEIGRDGAWRRDGEGEPLSATPGAGLLGVDVAFPALHGRYGEDGTVQGMLEMLGVPYAGSGVAASALCMDKVLFKELMAAAGTVAQVRYVDVRERDFGERAGALLARIGELGLPVFVKPAHMGSSVGIAKVTASDQLTDAIEDAFAHDARVIVEEAAPGIEVECGVLGNEDPIASQPGEIVLASGEAGWYDFDAKYAQGGMQLLVPARISERAAERVRELALEAFSRAGCDGLARADFFVDGERVLLNELNTMPGFTPTSVYAKLLEASGVPYAQLVEQLCRLGIERARTRGAHAF